jgi:prepilin-type N-terminal cleavage/methylation domain-containing protein
MQKKIDNKVQTSNSASLVLQVLQTSDFRLRKGFTLIEIMGAIFILTVGIGAAFSLIQQTLAAASLAKDQLVTSYLAQEGMEIVKNIRDTNWLKGKSWDNDLPASPSTYGLDYLTQALPDPSCASEGYLEFDGNFYRCSTNPNSKIKRKISIEKIGTEKMKVIVEVEWEEKGRTHSFKVLEYITNWYGI